MTLLIQMFIYIAFLLYITAAVLYFFGLRPAVLAAAGGCILNLLALIVRTIIAGRLPLSSGYEFILSFTFIMVLLYLAFEIKSQLKNAGGIVMIIAA
ncbi:MAG TPA: cytochrome C biogenesis protein CcsB, partial [Syntrophomonadaceae bacterium]|nr:cytochrome C biogenesis protein CcsB [Syntrophomonadaceae bacterium]